MRRFHWMSGPMVIGLLLLELVDCGQYRVGPVSDLWEGQLSAAVTEILASSPNWEDQPTTGVVLSDAARNVYDMGSRSDTIYMRYEHDGTYSRNLAR